MAAVSPMYDDSTPVAWSVCLSVKDAERTAFKAAEHGGKTLMPPVDVFDLGRYGVLTDPDGATFSIWQAWKFSGAEIIGDPNALGWIELSTRDPKQALSFYPAVFGWTTHLSDFYTEWSIGGTTSAAWRPQPAPAPRPTRPRTGSRTSASGRRRGHGAGGGGGRRAC